MTTRVLVAFDLGRLFARESHQIKLRQLVAAQVEGRCWALPLAARGVGEKVGAVRPGADGEHALVEVDDVLDGFDDVIHAFSQGRGVAAGGAG